MKATEKSQCTSDWTVEKLQEDQFSIDDLAVWLMMLRRLLSGPHVSAGGRRTRRQRPRMPAALGPSGLFYPNSDASWTDR